MQSAGFAHPPEDRYFEDYIPGAVHPFDAFFVDDEEVREFGKPNMRSRNVIGAAR